MPADEAEERIARENTNGEHRYLGEVPTHEAEEELAVENMDSVHRCLISAD